MSNIAEVQTLVFEGSKPNDETINNLVENRRQEDDLVLKDVKINTMYLGAKAIEKYLVTMLFEEDSSHTKTNGYGEYVHELDNQSLHDDQDIDLDDLDTDDGGL